MPPTPGFTKLLSFAGVTGELFAFLATASIPNNPWGLWGRTLLGLRETTDKSFTQAGQLARLYPSRGYTQLLANAGAARPHVPATDIKAVIAKARVCAEAFKAMFKCSDAVVLALMGWHEGNRDYEAMRKVWKVPKEHIDAAAHVLRWGMGWTTGYLDVPSNLNLERLILQPWRMTGRQAQLYHLVFASGFDPNLGNDNDDYIPPFNLITRPRDDTQRAWRLIDRRLVWEGAQRVATEMKVDLEKARSHARLAPYRYARWWSQGGDCNLAVEFVFGIIQYLKSHQLRRGYGPEWRIWTHIITFLDPTAVPKIFMLRSARGAASVFDVFEPQFRELVEQKAKLFVLPPTLVDRLFPLFPYHTVIGLLTLYKRRISGEETEEVDVDDVLELAVMDESDLVGAQEAQAEAEEEEDEEGV